MFRLGVFGFLDLGNESVVKKNLGIYGNFFEISIYFAIRYSAFNNI